MRSRLLVDLVYYRYIAPHMTLDAFKRRLVQWVETDWKSKAEELGSEWKNHAAELHRQKGETLNIVGG